MKLASENQLVRPLKRPLNRRPAQAAQKPNSPRRKQNGDRLHINPQPKSIDTLRAAFKERNYLAIQAHSSELLLKLALADCRFALQAHKELFRRKDYNTVSTIANHYCDIKTKDIFDGILSDWLDGPTTDSRFLKVADNLFFGEKIKNLFETLARQKELKTIAKILNLYVRSRFDIHSINSNWINWLREKLNSDEIKALADLLDPVSNQEQQAKMSKFYNNKRLLKEILGELELEQKELSNKKILLIGGGQSPIKKNLQGQDVHITNVDPISYDNPEDTADHTINEDFLTANIEGKFDEIWCLFSLPLYIVNPDDVTKFYTKALGLLADDGVLRISPIALSEDMSLTLKEVLLKPLVQQKSNGIIQQIKSNFIVNCKQRGVEIRKKPQTTEVLS
jgi:hypothetical protein